MSPAFPDWYGDDRRRAESRILGKTQDPIVFAVQSSPGGPAWLAGKGLRGVPVDPCRREPALGLGVTHRPLSPFRRLIPEAFRSSMFVQARVPFTRASLAAREEPSFPRGFFCFKAPVSPIQQLPARTGSTAGSPLPGDFSPLPAPRKRNGLQLKCPSSVFHETKNFAAGIQKVSDPWSSSSAGTRPSHDRPRLLRGVAAKDAERPKKAKHGNASKHVDDGRHGGVLCGGQRPVRFMVSSEEQGILCNFPVADAFLAGQRQLVAKTGYLSVEAVKPPLNGLYRLETGQRGPVRWGTVWHSGWLRAAASRLQPSGFCRY